MKELSIEEKAKRYDEMSKEVKDFFDGKQKMYSDVEQTLNHLFPELRVFEDEKIRKALIDYFDDANKVDENPLQSYGIHTDKVLGWLEKQGKEDSSIQQAYEWGYTEGKRIERKHWVEKQKFSEDYNSIDPQFGKPIEQNPAWSEEDEKILKDILVDVKFEGYNNDMQANSYKKINWLKSLKQRYTWKPSDDQMASITCAVRKMKESACYDSELVSLLNDLKKLTE